ncbi:MAG TPA: TerC/Alx family metal homeostasis membrane protein [Kofleriaceae bacterium]|jgi:tellurite resistance protein TerC|nr:TerC/Alx family metal homeostasis membrane protein [Kofleriaceae bacterium]
MSDLVVPAWAWGLLAVIMLLLVSIDLFAHRGDRIDSRGRALVWSGVWVMVAVVFGGFIAVRFGAAAAEQYFAAYLLEKSLSVDNLFLFVVVFAALGIPAAEQRRVLTWGIVGALVTRGVFIALGAAVLHRWHEITYVFGAILVFTAWKMLRETEGVSSRLLPWLERHLPWTSERSGHHFLVRRAGRWVATPLLVALIAIELTDVVFALDSIPAAFAVSEDPFIVYSSNVFAVLGLRALYVVLVGAIAKLRYLRYGLSGVIAFAGAKMLAAPWVKIPPIASVGVIALVIGAAVTASLVVNRRARRRGPALEASVLRG